MATHLSKGCGVSQMPFRVNGKELEYLFSTLVTGSAFLKQRKWESETPGFLVMGVFWQLEERLACLQESPCRVHLLSLRSVAGAVASGDRLKLRQRRVED